MRFALLLFVSALITNSAWARLGETLEQAEKRYGTPKLVDYGTDPDETNALYNTVHRTFKMGNLAVFADFFVNKAGVRVVGHIKYRSNIVDGVSAELTQKLLEANADGGTWQSDGGDIATNYSRKDAKARKMGIVMEFTLDEYKAYISETEAELSRKAKEKLQKEQERL